MGGRALIALHRPELVHKTGYLALRGAGRRAPAPLRVLISRACLFFLEKRYYYYYLEEKQGLGVVTTYSNRVIVGDSG